MTQHIASSASSTIQTITIPASSAGIQHNTDNITPTIIIEVIIILFLIK
jgi:hypothetical protein